MIVLRELPIPLCFGDFLQSLPQFFILLAVAFEGKHALVCGFQALGLAELAGLNFCVNLGMKFVLSLLFNLDTLMQ